MPGSDWLDWSGPSGGGANLLEANLTAAAAGWLRLFKFDDGGAIGDVRNRVLVVTGRALVGTDNKRFYSVNIPAGTLDWRTAAGGDIIRCTAVSDGALVGYGDDAGVFRVLAVVGGAVQWSEATGGRIRSAPVLSGANVIFLSEDGTLRCRVFATGVVVWSVSVAAAGISDQPLLLIGGNVYVAHATGTIRAYTAAAGAPVHTFQTGGGLIGPPSSTVDAAGLTHLVAGVDDHYVYDWNALSPFGYVWTNLGSGDASNSGTAFSPVDDRLTTNEHNSSSQLWIMGSGHLRAKQDSANTAGNTPLALQSTPCIAGPNVAGQQIMAVCMAAGDRQLKVRAMTSAPGGWGAIIAFDGSSGSGPDTKNPFLHSSPTIAQGRLLVGGEDHGGANGAGVYCYG